MAQKPSRQKRSNTRRIKGRRETRAKQYWSSRVTKYSNALDLDQGVFTWKDPVKIAYSLKKSAEASVRKKGTPYQSAMSMLNFYINRAGRKLNNKQRQILLRAKIELRQIFQKKIDWKIFMKTNRLAHTAS
jgi:hypothetical protein